MKSFVDGLRRGDYQAAYRDWGCTAAEALLRLYVRKFHGRLGRAAKTMRARIPRILGITDSESCNTGVLLTVAVNATRTEKLWVDKGERRDQLRALSDLPAQEPVRDHGPSHDRTSAQAAAEIAHRLR